MDALIKSLLSNSTLPIALLDKDKLITEANACFRRLTGTEKDQVTNCPLSDFISPGDWNLFSWDEATPKEKPERFYFLERKVGNPIPVCMEEIPLKDKDRELTIAFLFDCSEIEKLTADSLHMTRLASLGKLLTGTIHEISNPLSIINGCAQLLCLKELPEEIQADIQYICSESKRTSELIKRVLSFARKGNENKERFTVQEVIEEVTVLKQYSLKNNDIKLNVSPNRTPPLFVQGYRSQLMQVFLNLIHNAEQAISTTEGKGIIGIQISKTGASAVTSISDSGPGIRPENQSRIFDAFFTTKEKDRGTGMGLYLSRNIIQRHGGDLDLKVNKAGNTVFQIKLPLSRHGEVSDPEAETSETS